MADQHNDELNDLEISLDEHIRKLEEAENFVNGLPNNLPNKDSTLDSIRQAKTNTNRLKEIRSDCREPLEEYLNQKISNFPKGGNTPKDDIKEYKLLIIYSGDFGDSNILKTWSPKYHQAFGLDIPAQPSNLDELLQHKEALNNRIVQATNYEKELQKRLEGAHLESQNENGNFTIKEYEDIKRYYDYLIGQFRKLIEEFGEALKALPE